MCYGTATLEIFASPSKVTRSLLLKQVTTFSALLRTASAYPILERVRQEALTLPVKQYSYAGRSSSQPSQPIIAIRNLQIKANTNRKQAPIGASFGTVDGEEVA